ncbi:MAG: L,D-transpeptidase [Pseudomonadota bacterium]
MARLLLIAATMASVLAAGASVLPLSAVAGAMSVTNSLTGETFTYHPSFVEREARPSPIAKQRRRDPRLNERARVRFVSTEPSGTIVIDTPGRFLYLVEGNGTALRYGIGVGRQGFAWSGVERVSAKREWPDWRPPADMRAREPWLPEFMPGGPDNPLGAAALYLGSTLYRIHGTTEDHTIGYAVSSGCIRMTNANVTDLFARVRLGARVIVLGPQSDRRGLIAAVTPL